MPRFLLIMLTAFLLSACGAGPVRVGDLLPTPPATPGSEWTLRFTHSGGFAGIRRTMQISSSGEAVVADERTGKQSTIQLTDAQLSELRQLADTSMYRPPSGPSGCADCFVYTLEIDTGTGKPFSAEVDDTTLDSSGLSALVEFLRNIMEEALKS